MGMERDNFFVQVETVKIHANDQNDALATLVASYWIFNLQFDPRIKKTLEFLAYYIFDLKNIKLLMPVVRLLNTI